MPQSDPILFVAESATVTLWGLTPSRQYTYEKAMVGVLRSGETSQVFLCATDKASAVAAPMRSFKQAIKLNGPAITMCNDSGGVCILFKDESTLKDLASSVADFAPIIAQALDVEQSPLDEDGFGPSFLSDSLLSELSASLLSSLSDVDDDDEEVLGWEFVDN